MVDDLFRSKAQDSFFVYFRSNYQFLDKKFIFFNSIDTRLNMIIRSAFHRRSRTFPDPCSVSILRSRTSDESFENDDDFNS